MVLLTVMLMYEMYYSISVQLNTFYRSWKYILEVSKKNGQ